MSHDTGHGHSKENKTIISFKNSFWLVVIIVGLFIGALNFIQAESTSEEGKGEGNKTEMEAKEHHSEKAEGKTEEHGKAEESKPAEAAPAADTAKAH